MFGSRTEKVALGFAAIVAVVAYSRAGAKTRVRPAFVELPMDSIVKTLGAGVAQGEVRVSSGSNDALVAGRFERTYTLEFTAPKPDADVVHDLADRLRAFATHRGVQVTSSWRGEEAMESIGFTAPGANGWIAVMALKRRSENLDHFVVIVREHDQPTP